MLCMFETILPKPACCGTFSFLKFASKNFHSFVHLKMDKMLFGRIKGDIIKKSKIHTSDKILLPSIPNGIKSAFTKILSHIKYKS